ncbi:hypothetical protein D9M71_661540 [compost metagenome]
MDHQRHAERLEAAPGQLRAVRAGRRRQAGAEHVGEVHPAFLDQCAVGNHPGTSTTASRTLPGVLDETGTAVFGFKGGADAVLQIEQVGLDGFDTVGHGITLANGKATQPVGCG